MSRKGFTLIEISIVLVIISLIVAGITGATSLLRQATLKAVIREANMLKTSLNAFSLQFDALAGDFKDATTYWPGTNNGDGNESWQFSPNPETTEGFYAYDHLNRSEILPNGLLGYAIGTGASSRGVPGVNLLASKMQGAGWQFSGTLLNIPYQNPANKSALYISLGTEGPPPEWGWASKGVLYAYEAKLIDRKGDDGNPGTGHIIAYISTDTAVAGNCLTKLWSDTLPVDYVVSDRVNKCTIKFTYYR